MPSESVSTTFQAVPASGRVHIIGAGPVGLLLTALLQSLDEVDVSLYEKRPEYTRSRMVRLAPYLAADAPDSYRADPIDGDSVDAIFEQSELDEAISFRNSVPDDLMALLRSWTVGFCPLNAIERSLSNLINERASNSVQRTSVIMTAADATAMLEPGDMLVDCSGSKSVLRECLVPGNEGAANTQLIKFEDALVVTFLYSQQYDCNEYCKYYKNLENEHYKFIPSVHRTYSDGSITHVTGIVTITADEFANMPPTFDGHWLRDNYPSVAESMDRFLDKVKQETHGEIVGELEVVRIPLNLYRARHATSERWYTMGPFYHPFAITPVFLLGDSAIGSPYFQSISLGFECAMFLSKLIAQRVQRDLSPRVMFDRYEQYVYKQWLRVYMRSKLIKHNKDLLQCVDDTFALLEKLHLY
jgi:2-polyprenyl-6-methoxyphenol hydroxylase-like FAD-dependent oxidoreductase